VNRHERGVVILDGLDQQIFVPTAALFRSAVVFVFEDYRQHRPEELSHFAVVPRMRRRLHQDAVVADGHAAREGVIGDRETAARRVVPGKVVRDAKLGVFEMLAVQVDVFFLGFQAP